jgi:hypothetical protein
MAQKKTHKRPKNERRTLTNRIDRNYSKYVRRHTADTTTGAVKCYTCDHKAHWSTVDAGHFQSRAKLATRWHLTPPGPFDLEPVPINCRAQCKRCNLRSGEQFKFARAIDQEFGRGKARALEHQAERSTQRTIQELRDIDEAIQGHLKRQDRRFHQPDPNTSTMGTSPGANTKPGTST